ncbi:MAG: type II secretion system protein [bacterium]|nr:type II secretion system protein [bacterium]
MKKNGFTLVEVLVAMGISVLIMGAIVGVFLFAMKSNKIVWEQLSTQSEGRKVVQDFINELRTATASSIGAYPVATAGTQQIIFYTNVDSDTLRERVRYFLDGSNLKKGVIKPSGNPLQYSAGAEVVTTVVEDVANGADSVFYYFDQNYTGTGNPLAQPVSVTDVRVVQITLEMEEDPQASPMPFHIESKVEIRNLKTN